MTYAERFKPKAVIGYYHPRPAPVGCVGQSQSRLVRQQRQTRGRHPPPAKMNDRFWRMPLEEDYQALNIQLCRRWPTWPVAKAGDHRRLLPVAFHQRSTTGRISDIFTGVACKAPAREKGATGRPVAALVDYVMANEK